MCFFWWIARFCEQEVVRTFVLQIHRNRRQKSKAIFGHTSWKRLGCSEVFPVDFSAPATFDFDIQCMVILPLENGQWWLLWLVIWNSPLHEHFPNKTRLDPEAQQSQVWDCWNSLLLKNDVGLNTPLRTNIEPPKCMLVRKYIWVTFSWMCFAGSMFSFG